MGVTQWHGGKLVLLWVVCVPIAWLLGRFALFSLDYAVFFSGFEAWLELIVGIVIGLLTIGLAATPFIVTWKWFSAREKKREPSGE